MEHLTPNSTIVVATPPPSVSSVISTTVSPAISAIIAQHTQDEHPQQTRSAPPTPGTGPLEHVNSPPTTRPGSTPSAGGAGDEHEHLSGVIAVKSPHTNVITEAPKVLYQNISPAPDAVPGGGGQNILENAVQLSNLAPQDWQAAGRYASNGHGSSTHNSPTQGEVDSNNRFFSQIP